MDRKKSLESLTEEEIKVYEDACAHFRTERTYRITPNVEMKEALAHRYGLLSVEIYNRSYNRRERELRDKFRY